MPQLTTTVLSYLSPEPTDHILDIGCGDGPLTEHIASLVPQGSVLGLDASPSMIKTAQEEHSSLPNISFQVADCVSFLAPLQTSANLLTQTKRPTSPPRPRTSSHPRARRSRASPKSSPTPRSTGSSATRTAGPTPLSSATSARSSSPAAGSCSRRAGQAMWPRCTRR